MQKIIAIVLFILMYILMIKFDNIKQYIAMGVAFLFVILNILPINSILSAIDYNVILMLSGTMILVYFFIESKMPNLIADFLLDRAPNIMWLTIFMSAFAGVISAFIDNTATVLMIAPVALAVCKKLNINPVPMILCLAVSSNLQGAATLVGDTTSIMLGAHANMSFNDFFFMNGKLSIFFAVELGALASLLVMLFMFRKQKDKVEASKNVRVTNYFPTILLVTLIVTLIFISFIENKIEIINGLICMIYAVVYLIYDIFHNKKENSLLRSLRSLDFQTITLLIFLFMVIKGITNVGLIDDMANLIVSVGKDNLFVLYTIIVFGSAIISGFIDNIPYVATMLPVVGSVASMINVNPLLLYFGLLSGATLGGNLTPIGASANICACGLLRKEGYKVSFKDYMKIGIPLTLSALLAGYIFIWFIWA